MATTVTNKTIPRQRTERRTPVWQTLIFWIVVLALVLLAFNLRLYNLGLPFDRDGYDEGVYWQTLRAMSTGHPLYYQTFYSQPPFFMLSVYPIFALFGSTLWSARFGIVLVSLLALPGAFLLGKALNGRIAAIAAVLLLAIDPLYLAQSQTLQAEAPSVAFEVLAVGLVYFWWEHPEGISGTLLAALTGITASLSILSKFFGFACLVPIGFLLLARVWQIARNVPPEKRLASLLPIGAGILAFALTTFIVLLPFLGAFHQMMQSVVSFHTDAGSLYKNGQTYSSITMSKITLDAQTLANSRATQANSLLSLEHLLTSILAIAAFYGTLVALLRGDWRVLPLIGWLLGSLYLLYQQVPLFHHHLVILIPPLASMAVIGIGGKLSPIAFGKAVQNRALVAKIAGVIALALILLAAGLNLQGDLAYFHNQKIESASSQTKQQEQIAAELRSLTTPGTLVITDAQFTAGLANRNTPPSLVDTSLVRIQTGYLTLQQLIAAASSPQVHAVLFFTGRLHDPNVSAFHSWVAQHFHLKYRYAPGQELWAR